MSTYVTNKMTGGRIQLNKPYSNGIAIKNFPQKGGGFAVHINWPYSVGLNEAQIEFLDQYGLAYPKSFEWWEIRFKDKAKVTLDPSEMFRTMEALKPVISALNSLK